MTLASVPRYDDDRVASLGENAVVVGASMAGLLAARVLADAFDEVVVVERDPLPDEPLARRGTPQARHPHVLWEAGRSTLEDLFPGYSQEVISAGGVLIDMLRDVNYYAEGDFFAPGPRQLPMFCASRPLYEQLARRRVSDLDSVTVRAGWQVTDYLTDDDGATVEGVKVRKGGSDGDAEITADLVIDATGRTSKTPAWLDANGYSSPRVDEVTVDVAYSTTTIDRPSDDRRVFILLPAPPLGRGCFLFPTEDDQWLVAMAGAHGDHPPTTREELIEFADTLPFPEPKQLLDATSWRSEDIHHYPFPSHRRHRYEELNRFPDGLVVLGDAIASFNPVYGQGMSVASLQALVLHHTLASGGREDVGMRFFDRVSGIIDTAWTLAVGSDFQFADTEGPKPRGTDLVNWYLSRFNRKAHTDGSLSLTFTRVVTMQDPPSILFRPGVAWRVLKPG